MKCPECEHSESKVIDSRSTNEAIRRRRECLFCGERFTTFERLEKKRLWVIKRDGRKEPFKPDKVAEGIALACRKRPIDAARADEMLHEVEARLLGLPGAEVTSADVGEAVMAVLRSVDEVAFLRFASVYKAFDSVDQFVDFVRPLQEGA